MPDSDYGPVLSPDGKLIVTGNHFGLSFLDTRTGELRPLLHLRHGPDEIVFSEDGSLLATRDFFAGIQLWGVSSGKLLRAFGAADLAPLAKLAFSSDGRFLVAVKRSYGVGTSVDRNDIHVWNATTGTERARFRSIHASGLAISSNGKFVASWGEEPDTGDSIFTKLLSGPHHTIQRWDVETGSELKPIEAENVFQIEDAAFSPDGKVLAVITGPLEVRLYSSVSGREIRRVSSHQELGEEQFYWGVPSVRFAPDGNIVALGASDGAVYRWAVATGQLLSRCEAPFGRLTSLAFVGGRLLACGSEAATVCLWDAVSGKSLVPAGGHLGMLATMAFGPDGKELVSADVAGLLCVWDAASGRMMAREFAQCLQRKCSRALTERGVRCVLSPDGKYLFVSHGLQVGYRLFDLKRRRAILDLPLVIRGRPPAGFSSDGRFMVMAGEGEDVAKAAGVMQFIAIAAGANGRKASEVNETVYVCDVGRGIIARQFKAPKGEVQSTAVSLRCKRVVTLAVRAGGRRDEQVGDVCIWEGGTGKLLTTVSFKVGWEDGPFPVAVSSDGSLVAWGNGVGGVSILDTKTGKQVGMDVARVDGVAIRLLFSADGRSLAVGFAHDGAAGREANVGGKVAIFETATGKPRAVFSHDRGGVTELAFSPNEQWLASGSTATTILLWDIRGARVGNGSDRHRMPSSAK